MKRNPKIIPALILSALLWAGQFKITTVYDGGILKVEGHDITGQSDPDSLQALPVLLFFYELLIS